jgi:hypothetical protein
MWERIQISNASVSAGVAIDCRIGNQVVELAAGDTGNILGRFLQGIIAAEIGGHHMNICSSTQLRVGFGLRRRLIADQSKYGIVGVGGELCDELELEHDQQRQFITGVK